jgi:hypothetical protein
VFRLTFGVQGGLREEQSGFILKPLFVAIRQGRLALFSGHDAAWAGWPSVPLYPRQRLPLGLLPPVRPGVSADDAASGAHHTRAERWHWHVIGPRVRTQDRPMVALPARHVERPHAVGAHVAEGHRVAGWGSWSCMPARIPWPLSAKAAAIADMVWRRQLTQAV